MGRLEVRLYAARGLRFANPTGFHDPMCTLTVGSVTSTLSAPKSSVPKRKSVNPVWNQTLRFDVNDPTKEALFVQFFEIDDDGRQFLLGDTWVSIAEITRDEIRKWYPLSLSGSEVEIGLIGLDFPSVAQGDSGSSTRLPLSSSASGGFSSSSPSITPSTSSGVVPSPAGGFASASTPSYPSAPSAHIAPSGAGYKAIPPSGYPPSYIPPATSSSHSAATPTPTAAAPPSSYPPPISSDSSAAFKQPLPPDSNLRRSQTRGPFAQAAPHQANHGLIHYNASDLQRDFPHLARGSYGVVFKGRVRNNPQLVVIKDMEIQNQKTVDDWRKEIQVMSQNRSPYIAELFGYATQGNILTIVMEYFPKGDLYTILHKKTHLHPLSMLQRMRMARHCALGLQFLHRNHVIHRDMKSMNILVGDDYSCKLTDFGCAKLVSDRQVYNTVNSGTPLWMAPEVKRGTYSFPADVYSLGLVLFEIFERTLPAFDQIRQTVVIPPTFQSASVVLPCISPNPEARPNVDQVVTVLDNLIQNVVRNVMKQLPDDMQVAVKSNSTNSADQVGDELMVLFNLLLSKPAQEVDALINKTYNLEPKSQSRGQSTPSYNPQPPQHQYPQQYPHAGGVPAYHGVPPPAPNHGVPNHGVPVGVPVRPGYGAGVPQGVPQGIPPSYPTPHYVPPGYPPSFPSHHVPSAPSPAPSSGYPPNYRPQVTPSPTPLGQSAPLYPGSAPSSAPVSDEIQKHLESLTITELQGILSRHGVESKYMFSKTELIKKIKAVVSPSALTNLKQANSISHSSSPSGSQSSSYSGYPRPSTAVPSAAASDLYATFKLYCSDGDYISKEATVLCLQDLLKGKMEPDTVQSLVDALFSSYITKGTHYEIEFSSFNEIYRTLLDMCK